MKKLVAFAAVIAAVSFASCGNKSAESTESVAETEEATVVEQRYAPVSCVLHLECSLLLRFR